jgi:hypothetical protein
MFTRLTLLEIDTLRTDMVSAVEWFRTEVMPELRRQPGYAGVLVMATPEGAAAVLSFWETPEAANTTSFYSSVLERYTTIFRSPPGREHYQIALAELPTTVALS